jgi:VIT1/CCC1 family predicted Fe2+/Mn2+ transporter
VEPYDTLELISAEQALFQDALGEYETATTATGQLDALTSALGHAFGAVELAGRLRPEYPDEAEAIASEWRDVVVEIARTERDIIRARAQAVA